MEIKFRAPNASTRRASVAASARWRGDSTPSTRRCPCDRAGSMAWRLTKDNAIPQHNLTRWLISTQLVPERRSRTGQASHFSSSCAAAPEDSSLLSLTFDQGTPGGQAGEATAAERRADAPRVVRGAGGGRGAGRRGPPGAGRAVPAAQGDAAAGRGRAAEGLGADVVRRRALTSFLRLLGFSLVF